MPSPPIAPKELSGELKINEPHPAALTAYKYIKNQTRQDLATWMESFASCAIEGNRMAEVCGETLRRILTNEPVSDRYVLGLAWVMRFGEK